jgi:glycosyltransferase involved in cell wall biosynthesis
MILGSRIQPDSPVSLSPLVSIVVPAFNEGLALADSLKALLSFLAQAQDFRDYEVLVVDDGSEDETYDVAVQSGATLDNLRVVRHITNRGLGAAIRTGFAFARGSIVVTYDSDMSYRPEIIPELLAELENKGADLVLASPYMRGGSVRNVPWVRRLLSREANRFLSFATNGRYATVTCMVRAYRMDFFRRIETHEERMEINPELFFKAAKSGAVICEIPARLEWRRERARARAGINVSRTLKQIGRTLRYGVTYRPAVLLALPGILPGVLPLVVAVALLMHLNLKTVATVALITMIIQNSSLALFAGQLGVFARNVSRRARAR